MCYVAQQTACKWSWEMYLMFEPGSWLCDFGVQAWKRWNTRQQAKVLSQNWCSSLALYSCKRHKLWLTRFHELTYCRSQLLILLWQNPCNWWRDFNRISLAKHCGANQTWSQGKRDYPKRRSKKVNKRRLMYPIFLLWHSFLALLAPWNRVTYTMQMIKSLWFYLIFASLD